MPVSTRSSRKRFYPLSIITLAIWRIRQARLLLLMTGLGMVTAVIIVCAVPLFSNVMLTAGLRNTLDAQPGNAEVTLAAGTQGMSSSVLAALRSQFSPLFQQYMGTQLKPEQLTLTAQDFSLAPTPKGTTTLLMEGVSIQQSKTHFGSMQGRVPALTSDPQSDIEIMLTPDTAKLLNVKVGSTFTVQWNYEVKPTALTNSPNPLVATTKNLTVHVVGLFTISSQDSAYWHGSDFKANVYSMGNSQEAVTSSMLVSSDAMLSLFDKTASAVKNDAVYSSNGYSLNWYYRLDVAQFTSNDLSNLVNNFEGLHSSFATSYTDLFNPNGGPPPFPYLSHASLSSPMFSTNTHAGSLELLQNRVEASQIPVGVLAILIVLLTLFFVSLMTSLLLERQTETIAILRSRGGSSGQIFGAMLTQSILLGIVSLIIGIPLAMLSVFFLSRKILPTGAQDALNVITNNPVQVVLAISWYGAVIIAVAILTMSISLFTSARMDVLMIRRTTTRNNKRALWQRLNLDVIVGVLAVASFGLSLYVNNVASILEGDARTLVVTPISIIAPFFFIIGCLLLLMRLFPLLLRLAAYIATRGSGAVSLLALAQISRSPRQSLRMIMLLALATSFALFTLIYTASASQHLQSVTTYQTGADFSGNYSVTKTIPTPAQVIAQFRSIRGVTSVSVGFAESGRAGNADLPMQLRAVDLSSFAHTAIWSSQTDYQTFNTLSAKLIKQRTVAAKGVLPVIVDTDMLNGLHLRIGGAFTAQIDQQLDVPCVVVGVLQHIPTVNELTSLGYENGFLTVGGVVADYTSYLATYKVALQQNPLASTFNAPSVNEVWLSTKDDPASLANVRAVLNSPTINFQDLVDRRELLETLSTDPLYLMLAGILSIGTITAILLALIGDLLSSWLSARTRQTNFAIMRAIGTGPQEVAKVLLWEQVIVYVTGLGLGLAFGVFLAMTVIPAISVTDLNTSANVSQFYASQSAFPTQVVFPSSLPLSLLVFIGIFVVALAMMMRVVSQPSLAQTLRLNED